MSMGLAENGGGGRRRRRGRGRAGAMSEINVTPLVDVMLVLLIIFMVTAPLISAGVPIDLPDSRAAALRQDVQAIDISLDGAGRVFLDEQEVAPGTLADRLAAVPHAQDHPPQVTLRADRRLDYGRVVAVMGELNAAGFHAISLVTNATTEKP